MTTGARVAMALLIIITECNYLITFGGIKLSSGPSLLTSGWGGGINKYIEVWQSNSLVPRVHQVSLCMEHSPFVSAISQDSVTAT